jgi:D-3-phosphoglycerate dehydrogenase / 2-oxoglutarate reductase
MQKLKVLVTDAIDPEGLKPLEGHSGIDLRYEVGPTPEKLEKALDGVGAWLVRSETKVTKDWIGKAKALKLIGRAGVGVDNIDIQAATLRGIAVVNAPAANTIAACEHAVGLMLALARNIAQADADTKAGNWKRAKWMGVELQGKTLGVVGLGRIGREVAKRALSFGMRVVGFDPFVSAELAAELGVELGSIDKVFAEADFLTLHAPGSDKTKHLLNADSIKKLKKGVRIINCARGELIDEKALIEAVKSGHVGGAALDVFEKEPLAADSELRKHPQIILTPHLGASTAEAQSKVATELAESVIAFHEKGLAVNALNMPGFDLETMKAIGEHLELAENLGRFLSQMIDGGVREFDCTFEGDFKGAHRRPLWVASLKGLLSTMLAQGVTYISAPALAAERGIRLSDTSEKLSRGGYKQLITVSAKTDKGDVSVSGALLSPGEPRIVRLGGLSVEVRPTGKMIVLTNKDTPGVIGKIGTLLGEAKVNIADMRVGRKSAHGEAVMVLTVDEDAPASVREKLEKIPGITSARWVKL